MTQQKLTMYQLEKDLIEELNDNEKEILEHQHPEDVLHNYVEYNIPACNYDRLQLACDDLWLGYPSESGLSDGCNDAYSIIATNIYEKLSEAAHNWLNEKQQESEVA